MLTYIYASDIVWKEDSFERRKERKKRWWITLVSVVTHNLWSALCRVITESQLIREAIFAKQIMKLWTFPYEGGGLNPIPTFEGVFPHYKDILKTANIPTNHPDFQWWPPLTGAMARWMQVILTEQTWHMSSCHETQKNNDCHQGLFNCKLSVTAALRANNRRQVSRHIL